MPDLANHAVDFDEAVIHECSNGILIQYRSIRHPKVMDLVDRLAKRSAPKVRSGKGSTWKQRLEQSLDLAAGAILVNWWDPDLLEKDEDGAPIIDREKPGEVKLNGERIAFSSAAVRRILGDPSRQFEPWLDEIIGLANSDEGFMPLEADTGN